MSADGSGRSRARVAITGIGLRTPVGSDPKQVMDFLAEGRSCAQTVPELVDLDLPVTFACRLPDFDHTPYCSTRERRQMGWLPLLAVATASDALADAGLASFADPRRAGVLVGTGAGALAYTEEVANEYGHRPNRVPAFTVTRIMANSAAARLAMRTGARGPALTYSMACVSSAIAIGEAMGKIRSGELDVALAGGVEAVASPMIMASFARMGAMSRRNDDPAAAGRPFDDDRDGFVMGEAAAFLVLESWTHATTRGATILGEMLGYGSNSDAHHIVAPLADGSGAADCMQSALADAGLSPAGIGHVNAHGTSTVQNDLAEAHALVSCFGSDGPPVTSVKGALGHSLGASGAVEAVVALLSAARGEVPPIANFRSGTAGTAIVDVVAGAPRPITSATAMSNTFGFGGHNVSLVLAAC